MNAGLISSCGWLRKHESCGDATSKPSLISSKLVVIIIPNGRFMAFGLPHCSSFVTIYSFFFRRLTVAVNPFTVIHLTYGFTVIQQEAIEIHLKSGRKIENILTVYLISNYRHVFL